MDFEHRVTVPATAIMKHVEITVEVRGLRVLFARVWLGTQLIKLAGLIMGCNIDLILDDSFLRPPHE